MRTLLTREFVVNVPVETAWQRLAEIECWPNWARHIKKIEVEPRGPLSASSKGIIHLRNGLRSRFEVREFNPYRNWAWVGPFLWLSVRYDHAFEAAGEHRARLKWTLQADGLASALVGPFFARLYRRNLDEAIPRFKAEVESERPGIRR